MHSVALAVRDMKVMGGYALMLTSVREALTAVTFTRAATTSKVHTSATVTEDTEEMEELAKVSARREFHIRNCLKVRHGKPIVQYIAARREYVPTDRDLRRKGLCPYSVFH